MTKLKNILIVTNLLLGLTYLFLVNQVVLNLSARENLEREAKRLETGVAELEANYAASAARLTIDYAHELGFVDAGPHTIYATRLGQPILVSYGHNGD